MSEQVRPDSMNEQIEQLGLWWAFHKHLMLELFEELREGLGDEYLVDLEEEISEFEQYSIEIRRRSLPDPDDPFRMQVVSVLELLSPANKGASGARDRRKFLAKRQDYLSSPVSYTEIDLLRSGERELPSTLEALEGHPFVAWSSQVQQQVRHYWAWGWDADETLPTIGLPLEYPRIHPLDLALCYRRAMA